MANSDAKGFKLYKKGDGNSAEPISLRYRAANSATLKVGDAVRINTSGFLVRSGTTAPVLGVLEAFEDSKGISPLSLIHANNTGATFTNDDTVATASDNQTRTDNYIVGVVAFDPDGSCLYYNDADGDLATTNLMQMFDVAAAASNQISASSASEANGQWQLILIDPDNDGDASKGLFRIAESQLSTGVDSATAKVAA